MNPILPVLALALALVSVFVWPPDPDTPKKAPPSWEGVLSTLLLALLMTGAAFAWGPAGSAGPFSVGLASVVLAGLISAWKPNPGVASGLGLAAALAGVAPGSAGILGVFAGSAIVALGMAREGALWAAATAACVVIAGYLGGLRIEQAAGPTVAATIGLAAIAASLVGAATRRPSLIPWIIAAGAIVGGSVVGTQVLRDVNVALVALAGASAGLVIRHLLSDELEPDPLRTGIAGLIWLGLATLAFSLHRGFGISLAAMVALLVLLPKGSARGLASLGALVGLALYRFLREWNNDSTMTFDIGQHYALIGLVLGIVLPLLASNTPAGAWRAEASRVLWGLILISVPGVVILVFGYPGVSGFVVGLGIGGLTQTLRPTLNSASLPLGVGLGGLTISFLDWPFLQTEFTREEKMRVLATGTVGFVVLAVLIWLLGRSKQEEARS